MFVVTVAAEGVLDEPVVSRVPRRGEQHAVKPDATAVVVDLVLVPLPLGNLDDYLYVHVHSYFLRSLWGSYKVCDDWQ